MPRIVPSSARRMNLKIVPWRVALVLLLGSATLFAVYAAVTWLRMRYGYDYALGVAPLFDVDRSPNITAWYNALLFAAAAGCMALAGTGVAPRERLSWWGATAVLTALSISEIAELGSTLTKAITGIFDIERSTLIATFGAAGMLLAIAFLPMLSRLPRGTSALLVLAAGAYVAAVSLGYVRTQTAEAITQTALGELTEVQWAKVRQDWAYVFQAVSERGFRMAAPILCVYAVLSCLSGNGASLSLHIAPKTSPSGASE